MMSCKGVKLDHLALRHKECVHWTDNESCRPPFWEPHFYAYFAALFARCRSCEQPCVDSRLVAMASDGGIKEQTRG